MRFDRGIFLFVSLLSIISSPQSLFALDEVEPNNETATAHPLSISGPVQVEGRIAPGGDVDFYSFPLSAGDKVFAATMTAASSSSNSDSSLTLFGPDGVTVIENDEDDGQLGALSSSIAGASVPVDGTYFLRVKGGTASAQLRPYALHLSVVPSSIGPTPESEPNETLATASSMGSNLFASGVVSNDLDTDMFTLNLNAGDTVFASLDLDPERNGITFNGSLSLVRDGHPDITINDASVTSPNSEALFFTVREGGTYALAVRAVAGGGAAATYQLRVTIVPGRDLFACTTTNASIGLPLAIPSGPGLVESSLVVSNAPSIGDLIFHIDFDHSFASDLDVILQAPDGAQVALFTDVGAITAGMVSYSFTLDDTAALPLGLFARLDGLIWRPESASRMEWFRGGTANGVWTLIIRDDATGDGGTLNSWGITVCPAKPICAQNEISSTIFATDFESGDAGFSHSGVQDEWELGLPTAQPIASCYSGSNCWKTDLDDRYNPSSNQTLKSPVIDLAGAMGAVKVTWAQKYQMESANFDHFSVFAERPGDPATRRSLYTWDGATMTVSVGNPATTVQQSTVWGLRTADISPLLGGLVEVSFAVDSDNTVQLSGVAIDDFRVTACVVDSDGDGISDQTDGCINDPAKVAPGVCGCGVGEIDNDLDGTPDCIDGCSLDPAKTSPGVCGCSVADVDANSNSIFDCNVSGEIKDKFVKLRDSVAKVKRAKTRTQKKTLRELKKLVQQQLSDIQVAIQSGGASISVQQNFDFVGSADRALRASKKALRVANRNFARNKRRASKALDEVVAGILG